MLKRAILYQNQLNGLFTKIVDDPYYRFYTSGYHEFSKVIDGNNWAKQQFVSVDKSDNVIGFFEADIMPKPHYVRSINVVKFYRTNSLRFAMDFQEFFIRLFMYYEYKKINFTVAVGSPNEKWYDEFVKKYGGRIVGIFKQHFILENGTILDEKAYEIFKDEFKEKFQLFYPQTYDRFYGKLKVERKDT